MTDKRRGKTLLWSLAIVLGAGLLSAARPTTKPAVRRIKLTVSRKTTRILGPVNKDGTVNYMAYLNARHSKGVTKANNAAVPLIGIFGPDFLPKDSGRKICDILKIEFPSPDQVYFTSLRSCIDKRFNKKDAHAWREKDHLKKAISKPWKTSQHPAIAQWLDVNSNAMNATLLAVRRTRFYIPLVSSAPEAKLIAVAMPDVRLYGNMGDALAARAMLKVNSGDVRGAWADLTGARHLARRVSGGHSTIERLVALAIETKACRAAGAMAGCGKLTGAQAREFLADMRNFRPLRDLVNAIDESERFMMLDCVMMLARAADRSGLAGLKKAIENMSESPIQDANPPTTTPRGVSLEWDKILTKVNPWYDSLATAAGQKTFKARTKALADHDRRVEEFIARVRKSSRFPHFIVKHLEDPTGALGDALAALLLPALSRAVVIQDRAETQSRCALVAMALAACRAEKKVYPDKLSQLSPGYLQKVPDDLFVDKPFGYKRTDKGYLLYSVGENMKFDGEKEEDEKSDDIVVRVE